MTPKPAIVIQPGDTILKDGVRYAATSSAQVDAEEKIRKPQTTRLLKAACSSCGYTVRVTKRWADKGLPVCPLCTVYDDQDGIIVLKHLQTLSLIEATPADGGIDV